MNRDPFVETKNVSNFRKGISGLQNRDRGQPGIMVVEGKSGRGKSMAAHNWYSYHGGVFFRVWESMSQHAFLQELAFECIGSRPHGSHTCKRMIVEKLEDSSGVVLIDEADRLALGRLEDLRDINEATGVSIVLIGEEGLMNKMVSKQRLYSRVAEMVKFEPVGKEDIIAYGFQAADLKISPEAAALLARKSGGSFRMVHNYMLRMDEFSQANNVKEFDVSQIEALNLRDSK